MCHHLYFLDKRFKFQPYICKECHDVLEMCMNLNDIAILNIRGVDYRCIINGISKSDGVNVLQNTDMTEKEEYHKDKKL